MRLKFIAGAAIVSAAAAAVLLSGLTDSSAGKDEEQVADLGGCIDPSASEEAVDSVLNATDGPSAGEQTLEVTTSKEQAGEILAFDARVPEAPAGWTVETTIVNRSGGEFFAQCHLRTVVTDPAVSETVTVPAQEIVTETGEVAVREAFDWTVSKSAEVLVRFAYPSEPVGLDGLEAGDGLSVGKSEVNGVEAQVVTRDYEEPSVVISWHDDGLSLTATCSLMTVDECVAIAESTT